MAVGPATFSVLLVVGIVLVLGVLLEGWGLRGRAQNRCPRCRTLNRNEAQFCSQCGSELRRQR